MAKDKITDIVALEINDFLKEMELELYSCQFQKEGPDWFLRVFIDSSKEGSYISTDQCEAVSRYLSRRLDEIDPIDKNYYLEVSSPGMDRQLFTKEHFDKYKGEMVEIKLFKAFDGNKKLEGILGELTGDILKMTIDGKECEIKMEDVAKVNLAIIF